PRIRRWICRPTETARAVITATIIHAVADGARPFPHRTRRLAMNRRKLLKAAGAAVASTTVAAPAIAQSAPALRWRLATSFPKSLDTLYGACEMFAKAMGELSDQKFQIGVFGPGEIVPAFQVFDAVANNTVEMGNSASYYYIGKEDRKSTRLNS